MIRTTLLYIAIFTCCISNLHADNLMVMTSEQYLGIVESNHPIAKQATTFSEMASRELQVTKGAFDPMLKSNFSEKRFLEKDYWSIWQSSLTVPVWPGLDIKAAFDENNGNYLDPEEVTPIEGLSYLGVSMPLGQGLLIDARRAAVLQARQSTVLAEAERVKLINKLLFQATKDFWDWSYTYQRKKLQEESLRLASIRFEAIRDRVLFGEQAAIDSLEAFIEVQSRQNLVSQASLDERNARLIASNHLWSPTGEPVEITENILPESSINIMELINELRIEYLLDAARTNHPEVIKYDVKLNQLEIERKWAMEKLRPKLNLEYNFLGQGPDAFDFIAGSSDFTNNYKMGLNFSMPLFLREERGKAAMAKLKIRQTTYEQQQATREIVNQVRTVYNELTTLADQIQVQEKLQANSDKLLEGELYRFSEGEGFLFLVNARENGVINSRIRLAELRTKFAKTMAYLNWSAGRM